MLALYILLGLLGLVVLLLLLVLFVPVWARITYDGELRVKIWVLGVPITLLPSEDEPSEPSTGKKTAVAKPSKVKQLRDEVSRSFKEDGVAATLQYLTELAKLAGRSVGRALHCLTVDKLKLELLIADGDADTTAIRYGQVCSVLYPAFTAIAGVIKVRRRDLRVEPNFLMEKSTLGADVRLHIWVYRLVGVAIGFLLRFMLLKGNDITDKEETNYVE